MSQTNPPLSILTLNACLPPPGFQLTWRDMLKEERFEGLVRFLSSRPADVVCLQECFDTDMEAFGSRSYAQRLLEEPILQLVYPYAAQGDSASWRDGYVMDGGLITLSRYPIQWMHFADFETNPGWMSPFRRGILSVEIVLSSDPSSGLNADSMGPDLFQEPQDPLPRVRVINTHLHPDEGNVFPSWLDWLGKRWEQPSAVTRARQVDQLQRLLQSWEPSSSLSSPAMVWFAAADWNMDQNSDECKHMVQTLQAQSRKVWCRSNETTWRGKLKNPTTVHTHFPFSNHPRPMVCDFLVTSRNVNVDAHTVESMHTVYISDHYPVLLH